jgi:hypothetical protein
MIEHYAFAILDLEDHKAKAQAELIEVEALIEELIKEPEKSISAPTSPEDLDAPTSTQKRFSFGMR